MITIERSQSTPVNPLARFVTKEAVALLLNIEVSEIKEIRCWAKVILVVAKHLSRFVSYADLPPIVGVEPPQNRDFLAWRKRWTKNKTHQAPKFWIKFYAEKFRQAVDFDELYAWGKTLGKVSFALSPASLELLRSTFRKVWQRVNRPLQTDYFSVVSR
jgi:hypothetical protein